MKINKKKAIICIITAFVLITASIIGYQVIKSSDNKKESANNSMKEYVEGSYAINVNDLNEVVGDADNVFVGKVESEVDTVYKYGGDPYTNYMVTVIENIKGTLVMGEPIQLQKYGGHTEDGAILILDDGDQMPEEGKSYIFMAYAQIDGSLLASGPNSTLSLDTDADFSTSANVSATLENSTVYKRVLDAYKNQVETGRDRSTSIYEED